MRNLAIIGMPTYEVTGITAGVSEVSTMPFANLDTPELWKIARLDTSDPSKLWVRGRLEPRDPTNGLVDRPTNGVHVGGVALNHNMAVGSEWRILIGTEEIDIPSEHSTLPNSVTLNNMTGDETDIDDDPFSPTSDAIANTAASSNIVANIEFATPSSTPVGEQNIFVRIEYDTPGIELAAISATIFDGIDFVASWNVGWGGAKVPPSGTVLQIPFDAGDLTTASGANVKMQFLVSPDGAMADAGAFRIVAVRWIGGLGAIPGVTDDSGWLPATVWDPSTPWGVTSPLSVGLAPTQTSVHVMPGGVEVQATHFLLMLRNPFDQLGYVDVGRLLFGPAFMPGLNRDWGSIVSLNGRDVVVESEGGGAYGVRRRPMREMPIPLPWLTDDEWVELFERAWRAGQLDPFVVSLVESGVETRHLNLYVRWKTLPKIEWNREFPDYREFGAEVVETR